MRPPSTRRDPAVRRPAASVAPSGAELLRRTVSRLVWRSRFLLAAGLAGAAAAVVVGALTPDPPPTRAVVVTARTVAVGTRLGTGDVRVVRVAASLAPAAAYASTGAVRGRTASATLPAGTVLSPGLVAGDRAAGAAPDGRVVVALPSGDDPTSALLAPGDHVDLLATTADGSQYLARHALVLPAPTTPAASSSLLGDGPADGTLVVAVEPAEAERLAARPDGSRLTAVAVR